NGEIYLLADGMSYVSSDEGLTWKLFGTGLPAGVKFTSIAVNDSGMIYGGGTDGIMYRNEAPAPSSVAQDRMSLTNVLLQNYPNPFSGTTTIHVTLAPNEIAGARLNIYNMLGTPVADLTDKLQQNADITFDAGTLPEGAYYYILETPSGRQARQMFVVR
ncbi:MAG TPA: T9SS type A sorting domain-containing protein, partial [Candidatus Kapabacteria bacterium]|nr:T9SS type A sorting domain-containing protein [Candidatus Kapabacteria bacterium]